MPLCKKLFWKTYVHYVTSLVSADMDIYKMQTKESIIFHGEEKKDADGPKGTKNGYSVNPSEVRKDNAINVQGEHTPLAMLPQNIFKGYDFAGNFVNFCYKLHS